MSQSLYRTGFNPLAKQVMRTLVVGVMGSRCVVRRKVLQELNTRGQPKTPVYQDEPSCRCDVQYASSLQSGSSEEVINGRYQARVRGTIFLDLPLDSSIGNEDQIQVVDGDLHEVNGPAFYSSDDTALAVPVVLSSPGGTT